jgi:hypothetical protein
MAEQIKGQQEMNNNTQNITKGAEFRNVIFGTCIEFFFYPILICIFSFS